MKNKFKSAATIRDDAKDLMNGNYARAIGITFIYIGFAYLVSIILPTIDEILLKAFVAAGRTSDADVWIMNSIYLIISFVLNIMLTVLILGMKLYYLKLGCKAKPLASDIFAGFKENFSRSLQIAFMTQGPVYFALFPFMLCANYYYSNISNTSNTSDIKMLYAVVITGVVGVILAIFLTLGLRMSHFIMHDFPEYSSAMVVKACWKKMKGNRGRLLKLEFSLVPYWIVGALSLGVGMLWVYPFIQEAEAQFYLDLMNPEKTNAEREETV